MRVCDLNTGMGQLSQAMSHFKDRWADAKNHWHDEASRQFEKTHLAELPARMQHVVQAAQRLASAIEQAQRELDDRPNEG
jgi:Sec-independent protein translocase protein TatA